MSPDGVFSHFDRSILGIPSEDDEFTRGLIFSFDPTTGQPSVASTSQGSEGLGERLSGEASRSSHKTSSPKVFTPQSVSDATSSLHPQIASPRSVESFDRGSPRRELHCPHTLSVSACASAGTSSAAASPVSSQTPTHLPAVDSYGATTMLPSVNSFVNEPWGNHGSMLDPRTIIDCNEDDFAKLEDILNQEDPSRAAERGTLMRQLGVCLPCLVNHERVSN